MIKEKRKIEMRAFENYHDGKSAENLSQNEYFLF